jgi:exonuclease VII small subunit
VQPFGWFLKDHIDEGRRELNFSTFASYEPRRQAKKLDEAAEQIENGGMPLESYTLIHKEAKLTAEQKKLLTDYFNTVKNATMTENGLSETDLQHKKQ